MFTIQSTISGMSVAFWASVGLLLSIISYLSIASSKQTVSSRKSQKAKAMKEVYDTMEKEYASRASLREKEPILSSGMHIKQLFIYPIKSIQGCEVQSAVLTREGFHLDRRFMLLKDHGESMSTPKLENMHITRFPAMCLFSTKISHSTNTLIVSYTPPTNSSPPAGMPSICSTLSIPLSPESFEGLEKLKVTMHSSSTTAFSMGPEYAAWFSKHFNFPVILAFWGLNPRPVLGNLPHKPPNLGPKAPSLISKVFSSLPIAGSLLALGEGDDEGVIAFNDCAPYLVISETSVDDVSMRLPKDIEMDLTKFRANVVVSGAVDSYIEDYWSELTFVSPSSSHPKGSSSVSLDNNPKSKIYLTANCGRCASLNVDYTTGLPVASPTCQPLKLLQKDRRVDQGTKYSPVFGRYGFASKESEGRVVRVGDAVVVSKKNEERTRFYWPGLST